MKNLMILSLLCLFLLPSCQKKEDDGVRDKMIGNWLTVKEEFPTSSFVIEDYNSGITTFWGPFLINDFTLRDDNEVQIEGDLFKWGYEDGRVGIGDDFGNIVEIMDVYFNADDEMIFETDFHKLTHIRMD